MRYDLAIIGSGAAAFAAAIAARDAGASVVMVERGSIGGTCVNTGCVPSKALLAAAAARHVAPARGSRASHAGRAGRHGRADRAARTTWSPAMRAEKYVDLAADYGWEIIAGTARFAGDAGRAASGGDARRRRHRDDRGRALPGGDRGGAVDTARSSGLAEAGYLTSATAMELTELPESLLVIGGNAVGPGAGAAVRPARHPGHDRRDAGPARAVRGAGGLGRDRGRLRRRGHRHPHRRDVTARAARRPPAVRQVIKTAAGRERELAYGQVLVAAGRRPVTAGLNLDAVGVKTGGRGEIVTDEYQRTANPRIWAAGDVTGGPQFVYVAAAQGSAAAANALSGSERAVDYAALPRVTFTSPAIASAGADRGRADQARGVACDCRVLPMSAVPRAVVEPRHPRGDQARRRGRHRPRPRRARRRRRRRGRSSPPPSTRSGARMTVTDLAGTWAPYLTMSEALRLAAQAFSRDVRELSCCAA